MRLCKIREFYTSFGTIYYFSTFSAFTDIMTRCDCFTRTALTYHVSLNKPTNVPNLPILLDKVDVYVVGIPLHKYFY